nr:hypothetical protein [Sicyoidochytrium minutum DNA virus]
MSKEGTWVTPEVMLDLLENHSYVIWYKEPIDVHMILHARGRTFTDTKFVRAKVEISDLEPFLKYDE